MFDSNNSFVNDPNSGFILCYEGEEEAAAAKKAAEEAAAVKKTAESKTFTQEDVNRILAADRRKSEEKLNKTLEELEAQRAKSSLTATERSELDNTIEGLKESLMTKAQLAEKESAKAKKVHEKQVTELSESSKKWQTLYTDSTIERAIVDAASSGPNKAFNTSQVVAILGPNTRLVEALDDDGEKTGSLVPMVKFNDTDKDGKPVTLDLAVSAAVKRMRELDEYANLFESEGTGGINRSTKSKGGTSTDSVAKMAQGDPAAYRKARKEGTITLQ